MPYVITIQRHRYAPTTDREELLNRQEYPTRRAAMARIRQIEGGSYELRHGEHSRPTLRVRRVGSRRHLAAARRSAP